MRAISLAMTLPTRGCSLSATFKTFARKTAALVVCLAATSPGLLQAQINIGSLQTFDTQPVTTEWATAYLTGTSGNIVDLANLEAAVQQVVDATLIRGTVTEDMSVPFPAASQIARWSSSGHRIVTRPTTCAFTALLGTIINSSPVDLAEVVVAYDLGGQASSAEDNANELAGHIVYYSLTGLPNSWLPATDLSGGSLGPKQATLSLGLWPVGTHLYILWVDDNAVGTQTAGDGIYTIDNFQVLTPDGSPPKFLSATADPYNPNVINVRVDEPLCLDVTVCGSNARLNVVWHVRDKANPGVELGVTDVAVNGLDVTLTTLDPRVPGASYVLSVDDSSVGDLFGNTIPESQTIDVFTTIVGFRQGGAGYGGTHDTYLTSDAAATVHGTAVFFEADGVNTGGGISQGLLRFADIFGSSENQIPPGVEILSATLQLDATAAGADGSAIDLYRMLAPWDQETATWDSLVDGVQTDDSEALSVREVQFLPSLMVPFIVDVDVTASVKAWLNGEPNFGWVMINTSDNGYRPDSSESATPPGLVVRYQACTAAPIITQPPTDQNPVEGNSFTLTVTVVACNATFQWTKDGVDIPGATASSYTAVAVAGGGGNSGLYRVRVSNAHGTVTSSPARVTVVNDTSRPRVVSVSSSIDGATITIKFSKTMDLASAQSAANYLLSPNVTVSNPVLSPDGTTVTLATGARTPGVTYTLTVRNVLDNRLLRNPVDPNPTLVRLTPVQGVLPWSAGEWLYATNSQDFTLVDVPWFALEFVPGPEWLTGQGIFGFDDTPGTLALLPAPIATPLQPNNITASPDLFVTTYFRRFVSLPPLPADSQYIFCTVIDDGAIIYVDGVEATRINMAAGQPLFADVASGGNPEGVPICIPFAIPEGDHLLAVEVHQVGLTSDVIFGADIRIVGPPELSITRSTAGDVTVLWSADSMFNLYSATNDLVGVYGQVPGTYPLGSLTVPRAQLTNDVFFRLQLP